MAPEQIKLTEKCLRTLNLTAQPFGNLDPEHHFEHQQLAAQTGVVEQLVRSGGAAALILGGKGHGKSTLLSKFQHQLQNAGYSPFRYDATPSSESEEIIRSFLDFHSAAPPRPGADIIPHATAQVESMVKNGHTPVILIDNAETLNEKAIKALAELKAALNQKSLSNLGLVFAIDSDPQTHAVEIFDTYFPQEQAHRLQLRAFNQDQALAYLRFRLENAGLPKTDKPTFRGFKKIYRASNGNPDQLNVLAAKELEKNYGGKTNSSRPLILGGVFAALVVTLGVGKWAYDVEGIPSAFLPQQNVQETPNQSASETIAETTLASELKSGWKPPAKETSSIESSNNNMALEQPSVVSNIDMPPIESSAVQADTIADTGVDESLLTEIPVQNDGTESDAILESELQLAENTASLSDEATTIEEEINAIQTDTAAQAETTADDVTQSITTAEPNQVASTEIKSVSTSKNETTENIVASTQADSTEVSQLEPSTTDNTVADTQKAPTHTKDLNDTVVATTASEDSSTIESASPALSETVSTAPPAKSIDNSAPTTWLSDAAPNGYTLQLVGSGNQEKIDKFIAVVSKNVDTAVYQTERNGKPWFVVVGGKYESINAAKAAVKSLPKWVQKNNPWPRKISDVKGSLTE